MCITSFAFTSCHVTLKSWARALDDSSVFFFFGGIFVSPFLIESPKQNPYPICGCLFFLVPSLPPWVPFIDVLHHNLCASRLFIIFGSFPMIFFFLIHPSKFLLDDKPSLLLNRQCWNFGRSQPPCPFHPSLPFDKPIIPCSHNGLHFTLVCNVTPTFRKVQSSSPPYHVPTFPAPHG